MEMKKLILVGVMTLGLGLTSTLAAQHVGSKEDSYLKQEKVNSVVVTKKDTLNGLQPISKIEEVKSYHAIVRDLNDRQKRKVETERRKYRQAIIQEQKRKDEQQRKAEQQREHAKAILQSREHAKVISNPSTRGEVVGHLDLVFTYYTATCRGCTGLTRWGEHNVRNTVYVDGMRVMSTDPRILPPYSIIQFELNGRSEKAIALDTGSAILGHHIDLLVSSYNEAVSLGRSTKHVEVLRYGK